MNDLGYHKSNSYIYVKQVNIFFFTVVYICGPLQTFFQIMKLFEVEVKNPEDYAIFYLDVFAESLSGDVPVPWQGSDIQWNDSVKLFQV